MRSLAPLFALSLVAVTACGVANPPAGPTGQTYSGTMAAAGAKLRPATPTSAVFKSTRRSDDEVDIAGGRKVMSDTKARLGREGKRDGKRFSFPTRTLGGRPIPTDGATVPVRGSLAGPTVSGEIGPVANATVEIIGGGRVLATVTTAVDGTWKVDLDIKYQRIGLQTRFVLGNAHWKLGDYDWKGPDFTAGDGVDVGKSVIDGLQANGQAVLIHEIFNRYIAFFAAQGVDLAFWDKQIGVEWPAGGDYYSWGTVNLTEAKQWDVNGHEVGHAISDIGINMNFGGGQHYIDKCYDETLAWSEGIASMLGLAVSIAPDEADAKFQFMVKRRAPLRYENVPGDKDPDHPEAPPICQGPKNEWRAGAAMWDLYDTHNDGTDQVAVPFSTIWGAIAKGNQKPAISSVRDAYKLVGAKVDGAVREQMSGAAKQNTFDF